MILLDTSILIDLFRKKEKEQTLFFHLARTKKEFFISSITYYEIGIGNRKSHSEYWETLSENLKVLPFDKACSEAAIAIYIELLRTNKMIDIADLFIGATAITHGIPLATLNLSHFERISGLEIYKA